MDLETLYLRLPVAGQNVACTLEGWRVRRGRFGGEFSRLLAASLEREHWCQERIAEYRDRRLGEFVRHASTTVPYYRRIFREKGIAAEEIRGLGDLARLPILSKAEVQANPGEFISETVPESERVSIHTSGTTGAGLRFYSTRVAQQEQWATWLRYRAFHGLLADTWCGYFGGRSVVPVTQVRPPYWRVNYAGKQIFFSAYHMRPEALDSYVAQLHRSRPPWLHGYPSLLSLLAAHLLERGSSLGYAVRWITTGAENLLPMQASVIEKAFGVAPVQHYGMAEGIANFSQCDLGRMHVDEDFAATEFIPSDDGRGYRVVGTNFTNPATPLLRYEVQDVATLSDEACSCGRPGRIVESVDGRREDFVILRDGSRLGRLDHIFKDIVSIREAQIVQNEPGVLTLRIVRGASYGEADEKSLAAELFKRIGNRATIEFEYVDRIERTASGKLRFVISNIGAGLESIHA